MAKHTKKNGKFVKNSHKLKCEINWTIELKYETNQTGWIEWRESVLQTKNEIILVNLIAVDWFNYV